MLYELRVYHMYPGRLPAIHKRFSDVTLALFKKHGIKVCDFYEDADGTETIYYICEFVDRQTRDAAFAAFRDDPEWQAAFAASHDDGGPIVERVESFFMKRVPYIKPDWS
ncbi:MAG: NIPSNAP family protein [Bacillota bacterium]|nr:NIPSNAP family protein [Bacillota bacterium]